MYNMYIMSAEKDTEMLGGDNNLKDDNFLRQFTKEPLLLKRPNLEKEIKFVEKIFSCL